MELLASIDWETEIAAFLEELSSTQSALLEVLSEKRRLLIDFNEAGLAALAEREAVLIARLEGCLARRSELLARAAEEGKPTNTLRELAGTLELPAKNRISKQVDQAASRSRILQHQSITNWVVVQRSLIHLSQMLEIIATGGRMQPTYGGGEIAHSGGSLVDQAA